MKAAVLREVFKPLNIEDVDVSTPGAHEVRVRTVAAGVCHSDVHFQQGLYPTSMPIVLGHESAGIRCLREAVSASCAPSQTMERNG